tara:strand:- start:144 stop:539 length:396 start_codon:yes stop_codon:yes gene_type:complete
MIFHHLGIFVKSIDKASIILSKDLKAKKISEIIVDENLRVKVQFFKDKKGMTYELVEGIGENNPVKNCLELNKNLLNHIAYKTDNFDTQIEILIKNNYLKISNISKSVAFNNKRIIFLLSPLNFIVELIEN